MYIWSRERLLLRLKWIATTYITSISCEDIIKHHRLEILLWHQNHTYQGAHKNVEYKKI